jgi:hypothetical protein
MAEINVETPKTPSRWKIGALQGLKRFSYFAGLFCVYLVFFYAGLIPTGTADSLSLVLSVVIFALGIPLSIILRVDTLSDTFGVLDREGLLVLAAIIAASNFAALGALLGWKPKVKVSSED